MSLYVVFGGTGKLGGATIRELSARGKEVRAVGRNASTADQFRSLRCELAVADLHDLNSVIAALRGADAVQLICPPDVKAIQPLQDMALITEVLVKALAVTRPKTIVAISDYGAHLNSGTGVTLAFHEFESRLRELDLPITFLRSAEHMENWRRNFAVVAKTGILPSMHQPLTKIFPTVSALDVGVAAANLLMASHSKETRIVHMEGPKRYTVADVAQAFRVLTDREVVAHELPRSEWVARLTQGGSGEAYARLVAELFDTHNKGLIDIERDVGEIWYGKTDLQNAFNRLKDDWSAVAGQSSGG